MNEYGQLPKNIGIEIVDCHEMMFYQYLPIKMVGNHLIKTEPRINCFNNLIGRVCCDFIAEYNLSRFINSYIYLTAKHLHQSPETGSYNREKYHSDGFLTNDINYLWSNKFPTIFNMTQFHLSNDDQLSLKEMEEQAYKEDEVTYPNNSILRLDQFNIHKVGPITSAGMRTFVKVSFSPDKYNLIGNSHNFLLDYSWDMVSRNESRNIPQR